MGKLYSDCQYVMRAIEASGMDVFKSRGAIALETGFLISAVQENDPDDPQKMQALRKAAADLFQIDVPA